MLSLTEIASKAVGAARAAGATVQGYRGIFRTLKREHGEVSVLLMRVATERDGTARAQLFPLIVRELLAHAQAEDSEFYPLLAEHEATRALVVQLEADHERIECLLGELLAMPLSSPRWMARFRELQRAVQEHVDQEENQVFPRARRVLSEEIADEIDTRYRAAKMREVVREPLVVEEIVPPPDPPRSRPHV